MKVNIAMSARHVHLDEETKQMLFGDTELTKAKDLSQKGQYACEETLTIKTDKDKIENVRILGPLRKHTQVEISKTDSFKLGLNPPIRESGDLENSETIILINNDKEVEVRECCIIAKRHIHVDNDTSRKLNLIDQEIVKVKINTDRGGIYDDVVIRVGELYTYEMHIDTDEGNAFNTKPIDMGEIIK